MSSGADRIQQVDIYSDDSEFLGELGDELDSRFGESIHVSVSPKMIRVNAGRKQIDAVLAYSAFTSGNEPAHIDLDPIDSLVVLRQQNEAQSTFEFHVPDWEDRTDGTDIVFYTDAVPGERNVQIGLVDSVDLRDSDITSPSHERTAVAVHPVEDEINHEFQLCCVPGIELFDVVVGVTLLYGAQMASSFVKGFGNELGRQAAAATATETVAVVHQATGFIARFAAEHGKQLHPLADETETQRAYVAVDSPKELRSIATPDDESRDIPGIE